MPLPVQNEVGDQQVKQGVVRSRNGTPQARLFRILSAPRRKMVGIRRAGHRRTPSLTPTPYHEERPVPIRSLHCIGVKTQRGEIQTLLQLPLSLFSLFHAADARRPRPTAANERKPPSRRTSSRRFRSGCTRRRAPGSVPPRRPPRLFRLVLKTPAGVIGMRLSFSNSSISPMERLHNPDFDAYRSPTAVPAACRRRRTAPA